MKTIYEKQHAYLVRQYHILCGHLGFSKEDRDDLLSQYGVTSSLDLTLQSLTELCAKLDRMGKAKKPDTDKLRKQVIASIGGWLRLMNQSETIDRIKAIACKASGYESFNDIPANRLRNIYYEFLNKQKDFISVQKIVSEEIEILSFMN